ncbi:carbon-nitrogen hydrolase family protein [Novosphingobium sp. Fuku2-ISO-50]|uniref:carbon-nitrogen hydrolase family protein n=1 Tax=Novosphingobium sp. Fuku2-ISO-50 TaxID=1739114 RepID=UPI00076DEEE0|nr:carbon-nitrogen hydrolase family protein [Novosphingobium sp. Fuku2-ISO-50]KUR75065.1 amidohydrolase [Novosphingobium sp. Fuku2-ISO-50]
MVTTNWRVAAAQYPIEALADWEAYEAKLTHWVAEAAAGGAALAVFPEYGAMELASLDPVTMGDLQGSIETVSALLPRVDALHRDLARRHAIWILAASAPRKRVDGRFVNTARLFSPDGSAAYQDKLLMTRFEREEWGIVGGSEINLFVTPLGRLAVLICYDSEFPLLARAAVEAGADVLLVPSCTETMHGYWRVRIGSQARALEGQCYAVHCPIVGDADWSPAMEHNRGAAGIYGPPDRHAGQGFAMPEDGVLAIGVESAAQWVFADLDLAQIAALRADGGVLNARDWAEQPGVERLPPVTVVDLT